MNNNKLNIVIDPSHGGIDLGQVNNGKYEKDIILDLSKYMENRLKDLGIDAFITRDDDVTLSYDDRINKIKRNYGDNSDTLIISNSLLANNGKGALIIPSVNEVNDNLEQNIKTQLEYEGLSPVNIKTKPLPSNNNKDANLIQRNFDNAKVIVIEYGNIDDDESYEELNKNIYNYAEGVIRAIAINYGLAYQEPSNIKNNTHIVTKGESLYSIAQKYNTTIGALKSLNNLKNNILSVGQILKLPNYINLTKPASNITIYTVKRGDTLYSIAKQYDVSIDDLLEYNQLFNTILTIGQQLVIPIEDNSSDNNIVYVVKNGDTLYSIAKRYNVDVDLLKNYNNLDDNMIAVGQKLTIPNTNEFITYYVRTNDTLESIAKRFNRDVDFIKRINNLQTDDITIGQLLIIG